MRRNFFSHITNRTLRYSFCELSERNRRASAGGIRTVTKTIKSYARGVGCRSTCLCTYPQYTSTDIAYLNNIVMFAKISWTQSSLVMGKRMQAQIQPSLAVCMRPHKTNIVNLLKARCLPGWTTLFIPGKPQFCEVGKLSPA